MVIGEGDQLRCKAGLIYNTNELQTKPLVINFAGDCLLFLNLVLGIFQLRWNFGTCVPYGTHSYLGYESHQCNAIPKYNFHEFWILAALT